MKKLTLLSVILLLTSSYANAEESLLVCKGQKHSLLRGMGGPLAMYVVLTKENGKIIQARVQGLNDGLYELERKDRQAREGRKPMYHQLFQGSDRIILRREVTEDDTVYDIVISNTGEVIAQSFGANATGYCEANSKAF